MDPSGCCGRRRSRGIPRARGDGPASGEPETAPATDSPRSRGWTRERARRRGDRQGFPALAGMDPHHEPVACGEDRIPRARGDGPREPQPGRTGGSDSPRSRGWTVKLDGRDRVNTGFPALAGMDPALRELCGRPARIPRARGDGPSGCPCWPCSRRDSPRSRGWTLIVCSLDADGKGFPALAGMDPSRRSRPRPPTGIPRARGDGP